MYLGVDYGTKRIGLAVADPETRLAVPSGVIEVTSLSKAAQAVVAAAHEREASEIVVGYPTGLHGKATPQTLKVEKFIELLTTSVAIPVVPHDERLTTKLAASGGTDRSTIDERSATLILQSYLDRQL